MKTKATITLIEGDTEGDLEILIDVHKPEGTGDDHYSPVYKAIQLMIESVKDDNTVCHLDTHVNRVH